MHQNHLTELLSDIKARRPAALVTWLDTNEQQLLHIDDLTDKQSPLAQALSEGFRSNRSRTIEIHNREAFLHIYNPSLRMVVIGAVHITQALAPMARQAGYELTVIDPRTAFATKERFRDINLDARWPDEALPEIKLDARTTFIALTHDPKIDDPALTIALASDVFYIGALGGRRTNAKRIDRLSTQGIDETTLKRINAPVGLDIGAVGAVEIAVSILAEVTAALHGKLEQFS